MGDDPFLCTTDSCTTGRATRGVLNGEVPVVGQLSIFGAETVPPALTDLKRVSRPGLRRYVAVDQIPTVLGGLGISILSTPKGVMTGHRARRENLGGELLALVW